MKNLLRIILEIITACVIALLVVLKPIIKVKIALLWTHALGNLILDVDLFLSDRFKSPAKYKSNFIIFFTDSKVINRCVLESFLQHKPGLIIENKAFIYYWLNYVNEKWKILDKFVLKMQHVDDGAVRISMPPFFKINNLYGSECKKILKNNRINDKYICVHNRDHAYNNQKMIKLGLDIDAATGNDFRNSSIENYIDTIKAFNKISCSVVRVGRLAEAGLDLDDGFFDYASNPSIQSDFVDIAMISGSEFFICTNSGIAMIASALRKKTVYVNAIPITQYLREFSYGTLICFKLLWSIEEKRFLKITEILQIDTSFVDSICPFRNIGLEPVENTGCEIKDAAIEMNDIINNREYLYNEYIDLQEKFWQIIPNTKYWSVVKNKCGHRISSKFLYNHRDLLF